VSILRIVESVSILFPEELFQQRDNPTKCQQIDEENAS
jgi:hypothetical protein